MRKMREGKGKRGSRERDHEAQATEAEEGGMMLIQDAETHKGSSPGKKETVKCKSGEGLGKWLSG